MRVPTPRASRARTPSNPGLKVVISEEGMPKRESCFVLTEIETPPSKIVSET